MSHGTLLSVGHCGSVQMRCRNLQRLDAAVSMQDMPCRCILFVISRYPERMSRRIVLSRGHDARASVLVSQRHVQQQHGTGAAVVVHSLHAGSVLRVSRADVSDGSLLGGVFLRRRQLSVDAFQERVESVGDLGELQGRHVLGSE